MELPGAIKDLGESLIAPRQVVKILITERRGLTFSFFVVLVFSIVEGMVATLTFVGKLGSFVPAPFVGGFLGRVALFFGTAFYVILCICYWVLGGLIVHLFCRLFRGRGDFEHTLTAFAFLWIPAFIIGLLSPAILALDYISSIGLFLLLLFVSLIWGLIISVQALSEVHGFGIGKAFLSSIIPMIIIFILLPTLIALIMIW